MDIFHGLLQLNSRADSEYVLCKHIGTEASILYACRQLRFRGLAEQLARAMGQPLTPRMVVHTRCHQERS